MSAPEVSIQGAFDLFRRGRYKKSRDLCARLLRGGPADPEIHQIAAAASIRLGRIRSAAWHLQRAASLAPGDPRFHTALAELYLAMGRVENALEYADRARRLAPGDLRAIAIYARSCLAAKLHNRVIELLQDSENDTCESLRHLLSRAYASEGRELVASRRYLDSADAYEKSLAIDRAQPAVLSNLGSAYSLSGDYDAAESCFRRAIDCDPSFLAARSNLLLLLHYGSRSSPSEIEREHRAQGRAWDGLAPRAKAPVARPARMRLRIGYVSSDFRRHPVSKFVEPILTHHDRDRFEVFCYYSAPSSDAVTRRLRGLADRWRSISELDDAQAAHRIRADECDILIDLGGHTHGNRLGIFAFRPAPVQATYLGYPDTTGLTSMQYRITDATCDPCRAGRRYCSEKLVRISECFLCYRPDPNAPRVGPLPADADGRFTFGSLNQHPKLSRETVTLWAEVLRAVPGARLLLGSRSFDDPRVALSTRARFAAEGIEPARLELEGFVRSERDHLATYNRIDVALDPFPYNGATTTCEALWMGTPVITLTGSTSVSRMGTSLLNAAGLPEFIAESRADYLQKAARVASNRDALREMRSGLRVRISQSVLCDQPGFIRRFEEVVHRMWANYLRKSGRSSPN